jgi:hypothetical protein
MHGTGDFGFGVAMAVVVAVDERACLAAAVGWDVVRAEVVAERSAGFLATVVRPDVRLLVVVEGVVVEGFVDDGGVEVDAVDVTTTATSEVLDRLEPPHPARVRAATAAASTRHLRVTATSPRAGDDADQLRLNSTAGPEIRSGGFDRARWRRGRWPPAHSRPPPV